MQFFTIIVLLISPTISDRERVYSGVWQEDLANIYNTLTAALHTSAPFYSIEPFKPVVPSGGQSCRALPYRYTTCPPSYGGHGRPELRLAQLVMVEGTEEPYILKGVQVQNIFCAVGESWGAERSN